MTSDLHLVLSCRRGDSPAAEWAAAHDFVSSWTASVACVTDTKCGVVAAPYISPRHSGTLAAYTNDSPPRPCQRLQVLTPLGLLPDVDQHVEINVDLSGS